MVFPQWIEPMAATLTRERFTGPEWVFERKLDGIRILAFKQGDDVHLYSRNRLPQNASYPELVRAVKELPFSEIILDGEGLGMWRSEQQEGYHLFDIMWLDGRDLTVATLDERRAILSNLPLAHPLHLAERVDCDEPWELARKHGWEGVIAKRRDSLYEQRRSPHWLKMKCEASQELVVGGFTEPRGTRKGLGALLVGYYEHDELLFAGKVGTGLDSALLTDLRERLDALEMAEMPFKKELGIPKLNVHWVRPQLVIQVAFMEWTAHHKLRHPRFVGVRVDKAPRDVVRERG